MNWLYFFVVEKIKCVFTGKVHYFLLEQRFFAQNTRSRWLATSLWGKLCQGKSSIFMGTHFTWGAMDDRILSFDIVAFHRFKRACQTRSQIDRVPIIIIVANIFSNLILKAKLLILIIIKKMQFYQLSFIIFNLSIKKLLAAYYSQDCIYIYMKYLDTCQMSKSMHLPL